MAEDQTMPSRSEERSECMYKFKMPGSSESFLVPLHHNVKLLGFPSRPADAAAYEHVSACYSIWRRC